VPKRRVYLDWNATTPLDPRVLDRMLPYLRDHFGNPSSLHEDGRIAHRAVEDARESLARAIGADPREIVFCSGATEANNLALRGLARGRTGPVLVSAIEHPSILECAEDLGRGGLSFAALPVGKEGRLDLGAFLTAARAGAAVVAVMAANNETGVLQPVAEVGAECARLGIPVHVDAVQALGKILFSMDRPGIATASFSSHKIGGPKGVGALCVRAGWRVAREIFGGGQERGRRAGTENVAAIVGFGAAVRLAHEELETRRERLAALEARFLGELRRLGVSFALRGDPAPAARVPGTVNLGFPGVSGEGMLFGLDLLGVSVSLGSACSSGAAKPSHVLAAMGFSKQENIESVRVSLGPSLAEQDVDEAAAAILAVLRQSGRETSRA
jgi:cysteine desulfurase